MHEPRSIASLAGNPQQSVTKVRTSKSTMSLCHAHLYMPRHIITTIDGIQCGAQIEDDLLTTVPRQASQWGPCAILSRSTLVQQSEKCSHRYTPQNAQIDQK